MWWMVWVKVAWGTCMPVAPSGWAVAVDLRCSPVEANVGNFVDFQVVNTGDYACWGGGVRSENTTEPSTLYADAGWMGQIEVSPSLEKTDRTCEYQHRTDWGTTETRTAAVYRVDARNLRPGRYFIGYAEIELGGDESPVDWPRGLTPLSPHHRNRETNEGSLLFRQVPSLPQDGATGAATPWSAGWIALSPSTRRIHVIWRDDVAVWFSGTTMDWETLSGWWTTAEPCPKGHVLREQSKIGMMGTHWPESLQWRTGDTTRWCERLTDGVKQGPWTITAQDGAVALGWMQNDVKTGDEFVSLPASIGGFLVFHHTTDRPGHFRHPDGSRDDESYFRFYLEHHPPWAPGGEIAIGPPHWQSP